MRTFAATLIALGAVSLPAMSSAQDHTGYRQIATGDYDRAERSLATQLRAFPERPELMLNLAAVYRHTDRALQARAAYEAVLAQPNVLMDLSADKTAWSHTLARTGLRQLSGVQLSSR
jgi:Flp pilus assembly protein TadD